EGRGLAENCRAARAPACDGRAGCIRRLVQPLSAASGARGCHARGAARRGLEGWLPARERAAFETRSRIALARGQPEATPLRRRVGKLELVVSRHDDRAHLTVIELREAA